MGSKTFFSRYFAISQKIPLFSLNNLQNTKTLKLTKKRQKIAKLKV
jgi:hypothetical protein